MNLSPPRTCVSAAVSWTMSKGQRRITESQRLQGESPGSKTKGGWRSFIQKLVKSDIFFLIAAIPGSFSAQPHRGRAQELLTLSVTTGLSCLTELLGSPGPRNLPPSFWAAPRPSSPGLLCLGPPSSHLYPCLNSGVSPILQTPQWASRLWGRTGFTTGFTTSSQCKQKCSLFCPFFKKPLRIPRADLKPSIEPRAAAWTAGPESRPCSGSCPESDIWTGGAEHPQKRNCHPGTVWTVGHRVHYVWAKRESGGAEREVTETHGRRRTWRKRSTSGWEDGMEGMITLCWVDQGVGGAYSGPSSGVLTPLLL